MGCGKSTAGRRLADKLNYSFVDLDAVIEKSEEQSIVDIFAEKGQEAFREIEKRSLHSTFNLKDTVVSTGGGAPCFFDNMEQMNQHGITVYIHLTPKALAKRLNQSKDKRPIIKGKTDEELFDFVEKALLEREQFYNKSKFRVNGIGLSADRIIKTIM
jgi:shikimate kinase